MEAVAGIVELVGGRLDRFKEASTTQLADMQETMSGAQGQLTVLTSHCTYVKRTARFMDELPTNQDQLEQSQQQQGNQPRRIILKLRLTL